MSCIYVLAGTNGAGKSSIAGATFRSMGADWYDPDEAARAIRSANPGTTLEQANAAAWREGKRLLERAIAERLDYVFETTLGGSTITGLLRDAAARGIEVRVWYAGLASPELHVARVRARVARGGHDIPEATIRKRYDASRQHLIELLPSLTELRVYDNSTDADPADARGDARPPEPVLVLHVVRGEIVSQCPPAETPEWAKPIVAAAMALAPRSARAQSRRRARPLVE